MKQVRSVGIDVTKKCTLRCKHCYNYSAESKGVPNREMSDGELTELVKEALEITPESICLCGGEPLTRKDVLESIVEYGAKNYPVTSINMVSNGELMDRSTAERFVRAGINSVQISMDGATAATHDWLRNREGAFDFAVQALRNLEEQRRLQKRDFNISVSFCPTKKNYHELADAVKLAELLGVDTFSTQPLMLMGRATENLKEYVMDRSEYKQYITEIKQLQKMMGDRIKIEWGDPIDHLMKDSINDMVFLQVNAEGKLAISPYIPIAFGDVVKHRLGDYIDFDIDRIWGHPLFEYLRLRTVTPEKMNVSRHSGFVPEAGTGMLCFDVLEPGWEDEMDKLYIKIKKEFK